MVEVSEHLREDGEVYRVVGVSSDSVTLLRVTEDGRRRATGEVATVSVEAAEAMGAAADPDSGGRPPAWLRNLVTGLVWEVRMLTGL